MDRCYRPLSESPDGYLATLQDKARREGLACVVNGIIFDAQQRILVLRRAPDLAFLPSYWDLPGGHVEPGESLGAALRREILEETGWQLKKIDALVAVWDWSLNEGDILRRTRQFEFLVSVIWSSSIPILERRHFVDYRWLTEADIPLIMENRPPTDTHMVEVIRHVFALRKANRE